MGRIQDAMRKAASEEATAKLEVPVVPAGAGDAFPQEEAPAGRASLIRQDANPAPDSAPANELPGDGPEVAPVDDVLSHLGPGLAAKVVIDRSMAPIPREQYRRLAAVLHHAQEANGLKVVMIASAAAGEGKSLTAANLALTLSESYRRTVLLVDGDLRRPSLHTFFGVTPESGLSDVLDAPGEPRLTLYDLSPTLTLLPAGRPTTDPMAGLTSVRMRSLVDEAREQFGWIIIDTPPVGALSDANLLASMADGVLLIIKADATPYHQVQRAIESLGSDRVLGTVLNRVSEKSLQSRYGYYYSYYASPRASGEVG
jgi:capsular exopolysaccharide synthesis family protein